jgi:hypothetical protein
MERFPKDWPKLLELFKRIRADCDAAALALGFVPPADDSLASMKFVLSKLLSEAQQRIEKPPDEGKRKSGPHEKTKQFLTEWDAAFAREKEFHRISPAKLTRWIGNLRRDLRRGRTKSGKIITPAESGKIEEYIGRLEQRRADRVPPKRIGEIRRELADAFVKRGIYGQPQGSQDAETFIRDKLKRGRKSARKAHPRKNGGAFSSPRKS